MNKFKSSAFAKQEPSLWIERFVLYENVESNPPKIIKGRDILLHKGVNFIFGEALEDADRVVKKKGMRGHSVGKSTFCRLIRYALGESSFGRKQLEEVVGGQFPQGGVGITLYLMGKKWSVMKPFSRVLDSKAAKGVTLEELVDTPAATAPYSSLIKTLNCTFIEPLLMQAPVGSEEGSEYVWQHVLAMVTRDQEARLREFYGWRAGSRSGEPLKRVKSQHDDTRLLVRQILGLLTEREKKAQEQLGAIKLEHEQLRDKIKKEREQDEWLIESYKDSLFSTIGEHLSHADASESLFNYENEATLWLDDHVKQQERIRLAIENLRNEKSFHLARKNEIEELLNEFEAKLKVVDRTSDHGSDYKKKSDMEKLTDGDKLCTYGRIDYEACSYFQKELARLKKEWLDLPEERRRLEINKNRYGERKAVRKWLLNKMNVSREFNALERKITQVEKDIADKTNDLDTLQLRTQTVGLHLDLIKKVQKSKQHGERHINKKRFEDLSSELRQLAEEINLSQTEIFLKCRELEELFTAVIKRVLGEEYQGRVELLSGKELGFRLSDVDEGLSGEAINIVVILLADFTALLWCVLGHGNHPCFLMHDSPREADLNAADYANYLEAICAIEEELDSENTPFQYIVTTTTPPPESIANRIRLTLKSEPDNELLFGKTLRLSELEDMKS